MGKVGSPTLVALSCLVYLLRSKLCLLAAITFLSTLPAQAENPVGEFPACAALKGAIGSENFEAETLYVKTRDSGWEKQEDTPRQQLPSRVQAIYVTSDLQCSDGMCPEEGVVLVKFEKESRFEQPSLVVESSRGSAAGAKWRFKLSEYNEFHAAPSLLISDIKKWHIEYKGRNDDLSTYSPEEKRRNFVFQNTGNKLIREARLFRFAMRSSETDVSTRTVFQNACLDFHFKNHRDFEAIRIGVFELELGEGSEVGFDLAGRVFEIR